jgi:DNA repair exonuclease SbcCD ATPase subunit
MNILRVTFKNLLSFGNTPTTFNFIDEHRIIGICGENGTGKSSIFDAVFYSLFGSPFRKINKPDLLNRANERDLVSEIEFERGGRNYVIKRGMRPNFIEVYKDGEPVDIPANIIAAQRVLERDIIGTSEGVFRQVFMLGMGMFQSFFKLPIAARRTLFEEVVRIGVVQKMLEETKAEEKALASRCQEIEIEKRAITERIAAMQRQIENATGAGTGADEQTEVVLAQLKKQVEELTVVTEALEYEKVSIRLGELKARGREIEIEAATLENEQKKTEKLVEFYSTHDVCDRCGQNVDAMFKSEAIAQNQRRLKEIDQMIDRLVEEASEIGVENSKLHGELTRSKTAAEEKARVSAKVEAIVQASKVRGGAQDSVIAGLQEELLLAQNAAAKIEEESAAVTAEQRTSSVIKFVLSDEGFKRYVYNSFVPVLNGHVNEVLNDFSQDVIFELDTNLQERFWVKHGVSVEYDTFSNGEKQILDVSFLFGMQAFLTKIYGFNCEITFIDELWDSSLDAEKINLIAQFLRKRETKTVIISHNIGLREYFDKMYIVRKTDGFSQITEEQ